MRRGLPLAFHAVAAAVIVFALTAPTLAQPAPVSGVLTAIDADNGRLKVRTSAGEKTYQFEAMLWTIGGKSRIDGKTVTSRDFKAGDRVRLEFNQGGHLIHVGKD